MPTPTAPEKLSDARWTVIADLNRGESVEQTASYLVMNGWEQADALTFVQEIKDALDAGLDPPRPWVVPPPPMSDEEYRIKTVRETSIRNMKIGAAWSFGGLAVTTYTYVAALNSGGTYVITWGAVLYGAFRFLVGFNAYRQVNRQS
jgi:hypothetical protein